MSYGGGGFMTGSQTTPDASKQNGPTTLRPVTIAQILSAEQAHADAEYIIDGTDAKEITLVACIRNYSKTATNTVMQIEDGTGQIDARKWDQGAEEESNDEAIEVNTYVRIIGSLKSFGGKTHIACSTIRSITDKNEIMYHAIETVYVHLYISNGGPPSGGQQHGNNNNNNNNEDRKPMVQTAAAAETYSDLPTNQRKIMQYFASLDPIPEEGCHVNILHKHALPSLSYAKVVEEISNLAESGYVYYTLDDEHCAPSN